MPHYINDDDLYYEIILSKGKGKLTNKAVHYLQLIAKNTIRKKQKDYKDIDDMLDCMYSGLLMMLENWYNFNENKYKHALPYFTEIYKRGIAHAYNELNQKKPYQSSNIKFISIESCNDGNGMHNI